MVPDSCIATVRNCNSIRVDMIADSAQYLNY
jgi:hypothetical protein